MNHDIILKADDLYFSYDDDKTHSLNGLSLEIKRGSKVAFMGANGSGKSTFSCAATEFTNLQKALYIITENPFPMIKKAFWN